MSPKTLRVTKDKVANVLAGLKSLAKSEVLVGIPSSTAERQPDPSEPHPLNNAEIGYLMENGSPATNTPARPWLEPGVANEKPGIVKVLRKGADEVLSGHRDAAVKSLVAAGLLGERGAKRKITDGPFAPLAPSTIAKRKARGRTSEKPLIDSGQMRNAVTSVIRPKGSRNA